MKVKLQNIGNSTGVIIPSYFLKKYNLKAGSEIDIKEKDKRIIIEPVEKKYTLEGLLSLCTDENTILSEEDKYWLKYSIKGDEVL